tara:strand:- start:87 stop:440 length:354 start_codon:yes stop_codon:yes gene_type:complete
MSMSMSVPMTTLMLYGAAGAILMALLLVVLRLHVASQHRYLRRVEGAFSLNRRQRALVRKLVRASDRPDQAAILLVPSLFDHAVECLDPDVCELAEVHELRARVLGFGSTQSARYST